ncbi:CDP-diacylglycerol diphosphatase [Cupriavidus campinensis]|uniref:CDP-diacylglycerol diphosphatase n=1 Tax=Cupriavidus campinensis TaxID=151783 RepID=UPI0011EBD114|nr:CDP-diacylglycerol diphosphatase [Cupriavidus campinensis]
MRGLFVAIVAACVSVVASAEIAWPPNAGGGFTRNGLWRNVQARCLTAGAPRHADCAVVDRDRGLVLYKDAVGASHYLVIPDHPVTGVEDPRVWTGTRPDGWAFGWEERQIVARAVGKPVPDTLIGLAVNSRASRSQDQLHIHLDCISGAAQKFLSQSGITPAWRAFTFAGKRVLAKRVPVDQPVLAFNPFDEVRGDMGTAPGTAIAPQDRGIFLAYTGGSFVVVDEPVDLAPGNNGHASDFLDRRCKLGR